MKNRPIYFTKIRYLVALLNFTILKSTSVYNRLLIILLLTSTLGFSQEEIPFKVQKKLYVKGNAIVLGNTIVGKHKTKAFNSVKVSNDIVAMKYVDIDDDAATFSSSAAEILIPETASKIVYAGLYWSALYPAEKTSMRRGKRKAYYKNTGDRNPAIDTILIKGNDQNYLAIRGDVIFNADTKGAFKKDSPYSCYADITNYLNNLDNPNGLFTVANIKAVQGKPEGGSAGGWTLYIVYEDLTETPKYFTTYDGFRQINKEGVDITFSDFQAKKKGDVSSNIVMAALEGDIKIKSDECAVYKPDINGYVILKTETREANNFFKSSIDSNVKRIPNSKNTLGYDIVKTALPEGIIANNSTASKIKFSTKADRFYLLFTAFETEIEESFLLEKNPKSAGTISNMEKSPQTIEEEVTPISSNLEKETAQEIKLSNESVSVQKSTKASDQTTLDVKNLNIPGMASGYYLVTNVFSKPDLAAKWTAYLLREGYNPQSFINPENNWTYIYIERSNNLPVILASKENLRQKDNFDKSWVIGINR